MNSIEIDYIIQDNYKDLINKDIYETVVSKRMNEALSEILNSNKGKVIAIISHVTAISTMLKNGVI